MSAPETSLDEFLRQTALASEPRRARWTPLPGGVSSEIWRVDLPDRVICVKRALAQLRVSSEWFAPVSRNSSEWAWLKFAARVAPANVPEPLAHSPPQSLFAMSYLDPATHPVWKQELLAGRIASDFACAVGRTLAQLHAASTEDANVRAEFDTLDTFRALRLEPYLLATARMHPDLAHALKKLAAETAAQSRALVHGDVSPKNILVGPRGPVFLDAECAWYGDPAFDLAFCLTHLLLKSVANPEHRESFLTAFQCLAASYLDGVSWESSRALEQRATALLPALLLARIDGKSPVEYLTDWPDKQDQVRALARSLIVAAPAELESISSVWRAA
jgi:aminoglycoside phosphotransferase (APT) family kinase protein